MIDPLGIACIWFGSGLIVLAVVMAWRSELWNMIKSNTPGYGLMWRGMVVFICCMLAMLWPGLLFAAIKRTVRDSRNKGGEDK